MSQIAGRHSWFETIAVSGIISLLVGCVLYLPMRINQNWYRILALAWLVAVGGTLGTWCTGIWPDDSYAAGVPIILLLLATIASLDGKEKAGRCAVVLAWIVGLLFAGIIGAGLSDQSWRMLHIWSDETLPSGAFLFLLPAVSTLMGIKKAKSVLWIPISVFLSTVVLVIWTSMMLPEGVSGAVQWPFYEACKNLRLFGSVERFESFASVVVSMGYFAMFSYLLSAIREVLGEMKEKCAITGAIAGVTIMIGILLLFRGFDEMGLFISGVALFLLIPALWNLKIIVKK